MSDIRDSLQAIAEIMREHMVYVLEHDKYPLDRNKSKSLQKIKVEVTQARNAQGRFQGFTPNSKVVIWMEHYLEYLNWGRYSVSEKPTIKKVPISVLLGWIRQRSIRGRVRQGKGKGRFITNNQLAFMIQNSIYKNGIRGRHFIEPALKKGEELYDTYINSQLLDDITRELETKLKFIKT